MGPTPHVYPLVDSLVYPPAKLPGRPKQAKIDLLYAEHLYWCLMNATGANTDAALARMIATGPERVDAWRRRLRTYRRREHAPQARCIKELAKHFPSIKESANHPFWRIARYPCSNMGDLYRDLYALRPGIRQLLFAESSENKTYPQRSGKPIVHLFETLSREGDLDALSACLGLIHELKHQDRTFFDFIYTRPTYAVFRRCFAEHLLPQMSINWFAYLFKHFLDNPQGKALYQPLSPEIISGLANLSSLRTWFVRALNTLDPGIPIAPCLHVAERYLSVDLLYEMTHLVQYQGGVKLKNDPRIMKLCRALKRWQRNYDAESTGLC